MYHVPHTIDFMGSIHLHLYMKMWCELLCMVFVHDFKGIIAEEKQKIIL